MAASRTPYFIIPVQLDASAPSIRRDACPRVQAIAPERHLYLIQGNGRALRFGIGVGREGFQWQGLVNITRKAEWPDWTPPPSLE